MWLIFYYILKIGTLALSKLETAKNNYQTNCFRNHKRNQTTVRRKTKQTNKNKQQKSKNKLDSQ